MGAKKGVIEERKGARERKQFRIDKEEKERGEKTSSICMWERQVRKVSEDSERKNQIKKQESAGKGECFGKMKE